MVEKNGKKLVGGFNSQLYSVAKLFSKATISKISRGRPHEHTITMYYPLTKYRLPGENSEQNLARQSCVSAPALRASRRHDKVMIPWHAIKSRSL